MGAIKCTEDPKIPKRSGPKSGKGQGSYGGARDGKKYQARGSQRKKYAGGWKVGDKRGRNQKVMNHAKLIERENQPETKIKTPDQSRSLRARIGGERNRPERTRNFKELQGTRGGRGPESVDRLLTLKGVDTMDHEGRKKE